MSMHQGYICNKTRILINQIIEINKTYPNLTRHEIHSLLAEDKILKTGKCGYDKLKKCIAKYFNKSIFKVDRSAFRRPPKFKIGDKVRIRLENRRTPKYITDTLRIDNPRTITAMYSGEFGYIYFLGSNSHGRDLLDGRSFRSNELIPFIKGKLGRPCLKRRYSKKNRAEGIITHKTTNEGILVHSRTPPSISCVNIFKEGN